MVILVNINRHNLYPNILNHQPELIYDLIKRHFYTGGV